MESSTPVVVPALGQSPQEPVTLSLWLVDEGSEVVAGESVAELLLDGVIFDLEASADGRLARICSHARERVHSGQTIAWIDEIAAQG
jgi:pyruvate/2-oxoglutarate dehydrogenase complex dihydrolipoamide acyltransferase (E2) component